MRISPVLLLLPVLVLTGSAAIANDDRPASPQPAIASPVPAPLTIESLAGTYKGVVDEQALKKLLSEVQKLSNVPLETIEEDFHQTFEQLTITINANGKFFGTFLTTRIIARSIQGKVRLDGNKLILTTDSDKRTNGANRSTNPFQCSECTFTFYVAADRKTLLVGDYLNPAELLRGYVKQ